MILRLQSCFKLSKGVQILSFMTNCRAASDVFHADGHTWRIHGATI